MLREESTSGSRHDSPAVEKSLSDATEVAEMQRLAKGANVGKKDALSFHNWSGSSFISSI